MRSSIFLAVCLLPALGFAQTPTNAVDIGQVAASGFTFTLNGALNVKGSGADIGGTQDEFRFVNSGMSGDGEITARVDSMHIHDPWTKVGVMIRESLSANSRFAYTLISGSHGTAFQYRATTGGAAALGTADEVSRAPYWVRLRRVGNVFTAYVSANGQVWRQQGDSVTIAMGTTAYAGLAVTSHLDGEHATGVFSNITIGAASSAPGNRPPAISGTPPGSVAVGAQYSFSPTATDPDGNALTYSIQNRPTWAAFNTTTGRLSGTPTSANLGSYGNIVISVSDGLASAQLPAFALNVTAAANRPPVISGTPPTGVSQGTAYTFQPTASDPDGNALTFSVSNLPTWLTLNATTGRLQGTPSTSNTGTFSNIVITVSDGLASAQLPAFAINVTTAANRPPVISGTPPTSITQGSAYSFQPTASDPDGNALTFSVSNAPAWLTINTSIGRLQGTPGAGNVGSFANIVIRVTDGQASAQLPAFTLVVGTAPNRAPVISGTPSTSVMAGNAYAFQPTASDPDGDPLTFSVVNRPSWATLNPATGRLEGTPTAANVGTYANIVINANDGRTTTSLASFTVTVVAVAGGSATLSWTPPTTNSNGSPLTNLAGYRVYWGNGPSSLTQSVTVNNPGLSAYVVGNLVPGTYYFGVTALNATGTESAMSNLGTKTIR